MSSYCTIIKLFQYSCFLTCCSQWLFVLYRAIIILQYSFQLSVVNGNRIAMSLAAGLNSDYFHLVSKRSQFWVSFCSLESSVLRLFSNRRLLRLLRVYLQSCQNVLVCLVTQHLRYDVFMSSDIPAVGVFEVYQPFDQRIIRQIENSKYTVRGDFLVRVWLSVSNR